MVMFSAQSPTNSLGATDPVSDLNLPRTLLLAMEYRGCSFFEITGVIFIQFHFHVLVQISSFYVTTEGVCIGKQQRAAVSVFGF